MFYECKYREISIIGKMFYREISVMRIVYTKSK